MARVTVEDCLENVDSRFSLVHLAVRRVLQLRAGAPLLIDAPKNKEIVLALREIAARKITPDNIREMEEGKALTDAVSKAREEATHREVEEIVEAATQNATLLEFDEKEEFIEQEQDRQPDEEL